MSHHRIDKFISCSSALPVRPFAVAAGAKGSHAQSQASVCTSEKYELKCSLSDMRWRPSSLWPQWRNSLGLGNMSVIPPCTLLLHRSVFFMKAVSLSLTSRMDVCPPWMEMLRLLSMLNMSARYANLATPSGSVKNCVMLGFTSHINYAISMHNSYTRCKTLP